MRHPAAAVAVLLVLLACGAVPAAAFRKLTSGHRGRAAAAGGSAAPAAAGAEPAEPAKPTAAEEGGSPELREPFLHARSSSARTARRRQEHLALDTGDPYDGGPALDAEPSELRDELRGQGARYGPGASFELEGPYVGHHGENFVRLLLFVCFAMLCFVLWCLCDPLPGYDEIVSAAPQSREEALQRASTFAKQVSRHASVILGRDDPGEPAGGDSIDRDVNEIARARREEDANRLLEEQVRELRRSVAAVPVGQQRASQYARNQSLLDGDLMEEEVQEKRQAAPRATLLDTDLLGDEITQSRSDLQRASARDPGGPPLSVGGPSHELEAELRRAQTLATQRSIQVVTEQPARLEPVHHFDPIMVLQREEGAFVRAAGAAAETSAADAGAGHRVESLDQRGFMGQAPAREAEVVTHHEPGPRSALPHGKSKQMKSFRFEDEEAAGQLADFEEFQSATLSVRDETVPQATEVTGRWNKMHSILKKGATRDLEPEQDLGSGSAGRSRKSVIFNKAFTTEIKEDGELSGETVTLLTPTPELRRGLSRSGSKSLLRSGSSKSMSRRQSSKLLESDPDDFWVLEQQAAPSRTLERLLTSQSATSQGTMSRVKSASRARLNVAKMASGLCTPANKGNPDAGREAFRTGGKLNTAIGIDIGTSCCRVAVFTGDPKSYAGVEVIASQPSWVLFGKGDRTIGERAEQTIAAAVNKGIASDRALFDLENVVFGTRRLVGRKLPDLNLYTDSEELPFQVDFQQDGTPRIIAYDFGEEKEFLIEQIVAMQLLSLKQAAEERLGGRIEDCVLTVPGNFNELQRVGIKAAADAAGLSVLRLLNDPTAAAIAYDAGPSRDPSQNRNVLVCTMGGGAFDCSLVQLEGHAYSVKATSGDSHLGGADLDDRLFLYCVDDFTGKSGEDEEALDDFAKIRLRLACRRAKHELSEREVAKIELKNLVEGVDYVSELSRDELEDVSRDMQNAFLRHVKTVVKNAAAMGIAKDQIQEVVFVGGCSKVPIFRDVLEDFFHQQGIKPCFSFDPEKNGNEVVIGAALLAAALNGDVQQVATKDGRDVACLTLGNANAQGRLARIISRNTPCPVAESFFGITYHDDQDNIQFDFYQGECVRAKDNYLLGSFVLDNIPPGQRGSHKAEVLYEIDEDGMMQLSARLLTGEQRDADTITLTEQREAVTQDDIDEMLQKREKMEEEDAEMEEFFTAMAYFSQNVNWTRDEINSPAMRQRLTPDDMDAIDAKLKECVKWLDENDHTAKLQEVRSKQAELEAFVDPIFERVKNADFKVRRSSMWAKTNTGRKSRMSRATLKSVSTRGLVS